MTCCWALSSLQFCFLVKNVGEMPARGVTVFLALRGLWLDFRKASGAALGRRRGTNTGCFHWLAKGKESTLAQHVSLFSFFEDAPGKQEALLLPPTCCVHYWEACKSTWRHTERLAPFFCASQDKWLTVEWVIYWTAQVHTCTLTCTVHMLFKNAATHTLGHR